MAIYNEKGAIQEQDITFINIYALNIGAPKYIKYILKKRSQQQYQQQTLVPKLQQ